jgi:hypothetical protein
VTRHPEVTGLAAVRALIRDVFHHIINQQNRTARAVAHNCHINAATISERQHQADLERNLHASPDNIVP